MVQNNSLVVFGHAQWDLSSRRDPFPETCHSFTRLMVLADKAVFT